MKKDIDFLFEIGKMRFLQRTWQRFFLTNIANDAEHTFRVMWLALIIANNEKAINQGKLLKLALMHDITESRTGDVDYLSRLYAKREGLLAIRDMLKNTSIEKEFMELFQENEKKETIEAQIVKDADNLDIDMELMEQRDANEKIFKLKSEARKKIIPQKLFTNTAKKMFKKIYSADINSWHFNSENNRFKTGDWKK
ncbi:MAG TPA: HD domain-containing protein [Candidatus Moranbacteria bacterium]|nr:HD domain-containing protein [Candidatus Moranbacteria bacterium]